MKKKLLTKVISICMALILLTVKGITAQAAAVPLTGTLTFNVNTSVIGFAGQEWYVIGYNGTGLYSTNNTVTLLLKDSAGNPNPYGNSCFRYADYLPGEGLTKLPGNHFYYAGSFTAPEDYNDSTLQNKMVTLANDRSKFTQQEYDIIEARTIGASDGIKGSAVTNPQKLWALSSAEVNIINSSTIIKYGGYWWLRSTGYNTEQAELYVFNKGEDNLYMTETNVNVTNIGVRPAFKLNLSSVLLASNASGAGAKSGTADDTLSETQVPSGTQKLTIMDSGLNGGNVTATCANTNSGTTIKVSTKVATANMNVSAIIKDNKGIVTHYGTIGKTDKNGDANNLSLTLPVNLSIGGNTLEIFVEKINGDNLTDYASAPTEITVADNTSPGLKPGAVKRSSNSNGTVRFTSNKAGQYYYKVVASGAAKPTIDTSGAGTACSNNEQTITLTNLTSGAKDIYIVVKDGTSNLSTDTFKITIPKYNSPSTGGGISYNYHTITVNQPYGGRISSPTGTVIENTNKTFYITPDQDFIIKDAIIDGESVGPVSEYTFKNITKGHTIKVIFELKKDGNPGQLDNPFKGINNEKWFQEGLNFIFMNNLINTRGTNIFSQSPSSATELFLNIFQSILIKGSK